MHIRPSITNQREEILSEYLLLTQAEDRLTWIAERVPLHSAIDQSFLTFERRVPGCVSGLWLEAGTDDNLLYFAAHSDSAIVGGIASLLCDIYSSLTPQEILSIGDGPLHALRLEALITPTRRNALTKVSQFITHYASEQHDENRS